MWVIYTSQFRLRHPFEEPERPCWGYARWWSLFGFIAMVFHTCGMSVVAILILIQLDCNLGERAQASFWLFASQLPLLLFEACAILGLTNHCCRPASCPQPLAHKCLFVTYVAGCMLALAQFVVAFTVWPEIMRCGSLTTPITTTLSSRPFAADAWGGLVIFDCICFVIGVVGLWSGCLGKHTWEERNSSPASHVEGVPEMTESHVETHFVPGTGPDELHGKVLAQDSEDDAHI